MENIPLVGLSQAGALRGNVTFVRCGSEMDKMTSRRRKWVGENALKSILLTHIECVAADVTAAAAAELKPFEVEKEVTERGSRSSLV